MELTEFHERIEAAPEFACACVSEEENPEQDYFVIKNTRTGDTYRAMVSAVLENEWKDIEEVLSGKREGNILKHMSRIVGYYSRIENWNKSKIGELKDRHLGNYRLNT